jgi:Leucine-rich repeat (LRR) protein
MINGSYTCMVRDANLENSIDLEIVGDHLDGKSNKDVTAVTFQQSKLTRVPRQIFSQFSKLTNLNVASTGLNSFDIDYGCRDLTVLNISHNNLQNVDDKTLTHCKNLLILDLSYNHIEYIDPLDHLDHLKALKILNLEFNEITRTEMEIVSKRDLLYLNLRSNKLEAIKNRRYYGFNLIELDLSNNSLTEVNFFENYQHFPVKKVYLNCNKIAVLGFQSIYYLYSVEELDLSNNKIAKVHPKNFKTLTKLKHLDLRGNVCVDQLFENLNGNSNIVKSALGKCFKNYFDDRNYCHFEEKEDLGYTCTYKNAEIDPKSEFFIYGEHPDGKLDSDVVRVEFEWSIYPKMGTEIFDEFLNLESMNASKIGLVKIEVLRNCSKLETFIASNNLLEHFDSTVFSECKALNFLDLSSNRIKKLSANYFAELPKLRRINLSYNLIDEIAPCENFQYLNELVSIDFAGNKCIKTVINFKHSDLAGVKKLLGLCHSSHIINGIVGGNAQKFEL